MKFLFRAPRSFFVLIAVCFALSCSDCSETPNSTSDPDANGSDASDGIDTGEEVDVDMAPQKICEPGEIRGCGTENTPSIEVCNADGTAYVPGSCPSEPPQICQEGECVPVVCIPGRRSCAGDQPQICDEQGATLSDLGEPCQDGTRCEGGNCLNRCEVAQQTKSYIGCEYWAVELENHLLNDPGDGVPPLPEERRPPFAIILANTSTTYDTTVTAYMASGEVAIADGSRVVGADSASAGVDLVTVYSQVVSTDGTKLLDISGPVQDIPLPRQSVMTLLMPHRSLPFKETSLTQSAYRVVTTQPIVAYQFNPFCCNYNFTNDASLLLPSSALTEHYMFMGYAVWAGSVSSRLDDPFSGTLTVLATEEDTEVTVQLRPSKDATRPFEKIIYPSSSTQIEGPDADGVIKAIMQPHDVLNIASAGVSPVEDLTGAKISANKPVAAFAGHTCAFVPFSNPACDHLESQLFPLETWGRRFVAAPLKVRRKPDAPMTRTREGTYWKFVAYEDDTRIDTGLNLSPPHVLPPADEGVKPCTQFSDDPVLGSFVLDSGETCEFGTTNLFVIESQKPIMLGAFLSGQNSVSEDAAFGDHAGDPAFFLVPPEEQYRTDYSFLTPSTYFVSYVTVTVRPGFGVALDGQQLDLTQFDYEILPERDIARAHIPVSDGPHYIESAVPFGIVVYGYDDYVSYAYTGGLDLTKLNEFEF